jgi:hypothetical protein
MADKAIAAALSAEVKKISYRQTAGGMVIGFELHPDEVPGPLATAPLGTRYRMVLVELADDDTPVIHETPAKSQVRKALMVSEAIDLETEKRRRARIRAVLYAKNPTFQEWAGAADEESAKEFICRACSISSRREIADSEEVYQAFLQFEAAYLEQTGQRAEAR